MELKGHKPGGLTSRALRHRPTYRAAWLSWRNNAQRHLWLWLAFGLTALYCFVLARYQVLQALSSHRLGTMLTVAVTLALVVRHRKRRLLMDGYHSWLSALPHGAAVWERAVIAPIGVAIYLLVVAAGTSVASRAQAAPAMVTVLAGAAGCLGGAAFALLLPHRVQRLITLSVHVTSRPSRVPSRIRASTLPLGYWPFALSQIWGRPQIKAPIVLLFLLALPLASGVALAREAIAGAAAVFVGVYVLALIAAIPAVAPAAAWWLAPTPLRPVRFAVSLNALPLGKQALACVLIAAGVATLHPLGLVRMIGGATAWFGCCIVLGVGSGMLALRPERVSGWRSLR